MIHQVAGISTTRFQLRDCYLAVVSQVCGVSPIEVMTADRHIKANMKAITARNVMAWKLYMDGGLTQEAVGSLVGLKRGPAYRAINEVSFQRLHPKQYPLTVKVVEALNDL